MHACTYREVTWYVIRYRLFGTRNVIRVFVYAHVYAPNGSHSFLLCPPPLFSLFLSLSLSLSLSLLRARARFPSLFRSFFSGPERPQKSEFKRTTQYIRLAFIPGRDKFYREARKHEKCPTSRYKKGVHSVKCICHAICICIRDHMSRASHWKCYVTLIRSI